MLKLINWVHFALEDLSKDATDAGEYMGRLPAICITLTFLACFDYYSITEILWGTTNQNPIDRPDWALPMLFVVLLALGLTGLYVGLEQYIWKRSFPVRAVASNGHILIFILLYLFAQILVYLIDYIIVFFIIVPLALVLSVLILRDVIRWYSQSS